MPQVFDNINDRLLLALRKTLEVAHRADFCIGTDAVQTIRQESLKGDALAGFYSQWLRLEDTPTCPPHAWAWSACQHWQQPDTADWGGLARRFPEAAPETHFLGVLARPDPTSVIRWQDRYCSGNGATPRPVDALVREKRELLSTTRGEREELACAVMACAAAGVPEFAGANVSWDSRTAPP